MKLIIDTESRTLTEERGGQSHCFDLYSKDAFERLSHQWLRVGDLIRRLSVDAWRELQTRLRAQRGDRTRGQLRNGAWARPCPEVTFITDSFWAQSAQQVARDRQPPGRDYSVGGSRLYWRALSRKVVPGGAP